MCSDRFDFQLIGGVVCCSGRAGGAQHLVARTRRQATPNIITPTRCAHSEPSDLEAIRLVAVSMRGMLRSLKTFVVKKRGLQQVVLVQVKDGDVCANECKMVRPRAWAARLLPPPHSTRSMLTPPWVCVCRSRFPMGRSAGRSASGSQTGTAPSPR